MQLLCLELAAARRVAYANGRADATVAAVAQVYGCSLTFVYAVERAAKTPPLDLVLFYEKHFDTDGRLLALVEQLPTARVTRQDARRPANGASPFPLEGDASLCVAEDPPAGTRFSRNTDFTKRWTIQNVGPVAWTDRSLTRMGPCTGASLLRSARSIALPVVEPGAQTTIEVALRTPAIECSTVAYFKMTDAAGWLCWPDQYSRGLNVEVMVRETWPARYLPPPKVEPTQRGPAR